MILLIEWMICCGLLLYLGWVWSNDTVPDIFFKLLMALTGMFCAFLYPDQLSFYVLAAMMFGLSVVWTKTGKKNRRMKTALLVNATLLFLAYFFQV